MLASTDYLHRPTYTVKMKSLMPCPCIYTRFDPKTGHRPI